MIQQIKSYNSDKDTEKYDLLSLAVGIWERMSPVKNQGGFDARNPNQGIRIFRHGSRSFSRHIV